MDNYQHRDECERRILQCASCDATVVAEATGAQRRDADAVCALCGKTMTESAVEGGDYFEVVMRVGRPTGRAVRSRRAGKEDTQR